MYRPHTAEKLQINNEKPPKTKGMERLEKSLRNCSCGPGDNFLFKIRHGDITGDEKISESEFFFMIKNNKISPFKNFIEKKKNIPSRKILKEAMKKSPFKRILENNFSKNTIDDIF